MSDVLQSTTALVTGASSGIGAATAIRLAAEGATVALVARRRDRRDEVAAAIEAAGGPAVVVEADASDQKSAEAAVNDAVDRMGRLDILVNNAAKNPSRSACAWASSSPALSTQNSSPT